MKGGRIGTYFYMAPEIFVQGKEATTASDVWSFGCTIVELFTKKPVWESPDIEGCVFDFYGCVFHHLTNKHQPTMNLVPGTIKESLKACFNYEPTKRPKMIDLIPLFLKPSQINN